MTRVVIGTERGLHRLDGHVEMADAVVAHVAAGWAVADGRLRVQAVGGWTDVDMPDTDRVTCVAATAAGALAGTAGAHLVDVADGHVVPVTSFDAAPTRSGWHTPWGGPPDVRSIAVAGDATTYVNVHVGGILRHDDDGWHPTIDLHTDVHQVVTVDGRVLAALGAGGLAVSDDRGATWHRRTDGLHATYCRAVAVADDTIVLSASDGPSGHRAALYRSPLDHEAPFERCVDGLPEWFDSNIDTHTLMAIGAEVFAGTHLGTVYRSPDAGHTWEPVVDGLPPIRCIDVSE